MLKSLLLFLTLTTLLGCSDSTVTTKAETSGNEIWIDVRSADEYSTGHLEQAGNIPHTEIAERIAEITSDKSAPIHVYCRSGNRSGKAKVILESLGFTNVTNEGAYSDLIQKEAANTD